MKLFKQIFQYSLAAIFALVTMAPAEALTLDQARELYKAGKYAEAAPVFKAQLKRRPNDGSLNHWYGVCLFHEKKYDEAEKYLKVGVKRKVLESPHFLGDVYMAQYRFDDAAASYQDYIDALEKNKKQVPDSVTEAIARARKAKLMLNHVEQVQVIDSLIVDADSFFEHFKMTPESGRIGTAETLDVAIPDSTIGYMPQRGDKVFFGMPVEGKGYELCAMYDIFITRLNLENNTYLKPENVGMPFNSIYNDYMMAVDEMLNIGWFVSDREQIPGKVTIYLFIPNPSKQTYDLDEIKTDIKSLALIRSIRDSWPEGADYTDLLQQLNGIQEAQVVKRPDFVFAICNGVHYTTLDQFTSAEARNLYVKANETRKHIAQLESKVAELRPKYAKSQGTTRQRLSVEIGALESQLLSLYPQPGEYENQARKAELDALQKRR